MNGHSKSEGGDKQTPATKPEDVGTVVFEALLVRANKSAATLAAMSITQDKLDSAARACAVACSQKIYLQATSSALKIGKMEEITPAQILDEIARQSGVKLTIKKTAARKNPPKKGGQDG